LKFLVCFVATSYSVGCFSPSVEHQIEDLFSDPTLSKASAKVSKAGSRHIVKVMGEFESVSAYENALETIKHSPVSYSKKITIVNELVLKPLPVEELSEALRQAGWKGVSLEQFSSTLIVSARLPDIKTKKALQDEIESLCVDRKCSPLFWMLMTETELEVHAKTKNQRAAKEAIKAYSSYASHGFDSDATRLSPEDRAYMKEYPNRLYNGEPCQPGDKLDNGSFTPNNRIYLRERPSNSSPRLINFRASSILGSREYKSVDTDMTAHIDCKRGDWRRVWVNSPYWLQRSHVGWVKINLN